MQISMIAAMTVNRVIGKDNQMPWHLPEDLKHFKATTMSYPIVMGRKTYESIGRPLPGRHNIVISRQADLEIDGVTVVATFDEAKLAAGDVEQLFVIGGGQLYQQLLPKADKLFLTEINIDVEGDTYFPDWNDGSWKEESKESGISSDGLEYSFINLVKKC
ncbi:type 3 dihydrofolate reductase [Parashewanella tropica]|uniref:type 3 dihydrofolate reductase n=1 Tax=Parashewanella tropica TaxID=2547970 RepID=UPI001059FFDF|nr:type 3 dihydrofolate reductase [Parashewanella tropica]